MPQDLPGAIYNTVTRLRSALSDTAPSFYFRFAEWVVIFGEPRPGALPPVP